MTIRTVPIGARGQYRVKVDARDYAWVTQWRWSFYRFSWRWGASIYARRSVWRGGRNVTAEAHGFVKDAESLALWKSRRDELLDELDRLDAKTRGQAGIRVIGPTP